MTLTAEEREQEMLDWLIQWGQAHEFHPGDGADQHTHHPRRAAGRLFRL